MKTHKQLIQSIDKWIQNSLLTKIILWVAVFCYPLYLTIIANFLSYQSTTLLSSLVQNQRGAFLYGLLLVSLIFWALAAMLSKIYIAAILAGFICIITPLVDYLKCMILTEHLFPSDLLLIRNATNFTDFLSTLTIPANIWGISLLTVLYCVIIYLANAKISIHWHYRISSVFVFVLLICGLTTNGIVRNLSFDAFNLHITDSMDQDKVYQEFGFISAFALNVGSLSTNAPDTYSQDYIEESFSAYLPRENDTSDFQHPDIIVILSESYWDPTVLNGVTFSADPLENYRYIAKTNPGGNMISPTFGGGTVRPEFEIMTGLTTSSLPSGNIPYQQYNMLRVFSYPRVYRELGYDTVGIHTYQKNFYDRDKAYPLLGFDEFLGEYDLNAEHHWNSGPYITDETISEEVIYQLSQPRDNSVFVMAITMENHGLYREKYNASDWKITVSGDSLNERQVIALQNFVTGTSNSDRALREIYDYVMEREKPTVVLWYGDHLPTLGEDFMPYTTTGTITSDKASEWTQEEKMTMFSTPFLVFTNYDTGRTFRAQGESVSPYYLPALLADYIGAPETLQTNFLLKLYETSPIISSYYTLYSPGSDPQERDRMIALHELLTYDQLMGENYTGNMQHRTR